MAIVGGLLCGLATFAMVHVVLDVGLVVEIPIAVLSAVIASGTLQRSRRG
jgi:hypothetical protein